MEEEQAHRNQISANKSAINYEQDRWFFTDHDRIARCRKQIQEAEANIKSNQELLKKYKRLLNAVATELVRESSKFVVFKDGKETYFSPEDLISEI